MAAEAGTTRVFVRGLPPTLTEQDLRSHFACRYPVTDAKLLTHRRIGYVGFKTAEDAEAATRYFNKSFMRLSKIRVELAKTVRTLLRFSSFAGAYTTLLAAEILKTSAHGQYSRAGTAQEEHS